MIPEPEPRPDDDDEVRREEHRLYAQTALAQVGFVACLCGRVYVMAEPYVSHVMYCVYGGKD